MYPELKKHILKGCSEFLVGALVSRSKYIEIGAHCILDMKNTSIGMYDEITDIFKNSNNIAKSINEYLYENPCSISTTYPFVNNAEKVPGIIFKKSVSSTEVYCINEPPIVLDDTYLSVELKDIQELIPDDMYSLSENIYTLLKKHRYINYIIQGLSLSKYECIVNNISKLHKIFNRVYKQNLCNFISGNGSNTLLDVLSISFYKLSDVIPIFDQLHSEGVVIDILLTNSQIQLDNIDHLPNSFMLTRFIFSKYKDNVFTIDGEKINRPCNLPISLTIEDIISKSLKNYTPDDRLITKEMSNKRGE